MSGGGKSQGDIDFSKVDFTVPTKKNWFFWKAV